MADSNTPVFGTLLKGDSSMFGGLTSSVSLAASGGAMSEDESVTFVKQDGSATTTLNATVKLEGVFKRIIDGGNTHEARSLSVQSVKMTLSENPADTLGVALESDDTVVWRGMSLLAVGTAIESAPNVWTVMAELVV